MKVTRTEKGFTIHLEATEASILYYCCRKMIEVYTGDASKYSIKYTDQPLTEHGFKGWEEAQEDFKAAQAEWKGLRHELCQKITKAIVNPLSSLELELNFDEKETLLELINERRVFLFFQHDITEKQMHLLEQEKVDQSDPLFPILAEIHILGVLQFVMLQTTSA